MTSFLELPGRIWNLAVVVSSRVETVLMTGHTAGLRVHYAGVGAAVAHLPLHQHPSDTQPWTRPYLLSLNHFPLWKEFLNGYEQIYPPHTEEVMKGSPLWATTKPWFITMKQHLGLSNSTRTKPEVSQIDVIARMLDCCWMATESRQRAQSKQDTPNTLGNVPWKSLCCCCCWFTLVLGIKPSSSKMLDKWLIPQLYPVSQKSLQKWHEEGFSLSIWIRDCLFVLRLDLV